MKKAFVVFIVVAVIGTFTIAQPIVSKYWQDVLRKPSQAWQSQYSRNMSEVTNLMVAIQDVFDVIAKNDSDIAFNVRSLLEVQESMAQMIVALQADVEALENPVDVNDPNEVKE